jgi:hypothetical protein
MIMNSLQFVCFIIELRQSVSRAVNNTEYLRNRQHKVEDLWEEAQEHGLCEVAQNPDHGKSHACEIAEGISHKHFRREFVMLQQAKGHKNERNNDGE